MSNIDKTLMNIMAAMDGNGSLNDRGSVGGAPSAAGTNQYIPSSPPRIDSALMGFSAALEDIAPSENASSSNTLSTNGHSDAPVYNESNIAPPVGVIVDPLLAKFTCLLNETEAALHTTTKALVEDSTHYPELRAAIQTEPTANGVRIGSWEIKAVAGRFTTYNVSHTVTGEPIAENLRILDAAQALVKALNEGKGITSDRVKDIIHAEEEYSRALDDAVRFSQRAKLSEGHAKAVAEDRYDSAKARALTAKKAIRALFNSY